MSGPFPSPSRLRDTPGPAWTRRQREVLDLLVRGQTNAQIAEALGISLDGAKWHVSEIITKLGVDSRDEAAEYWRAHTGLRLRFSRLLQSLVPGLGWLKVGAGVAVVAGASVAAALVMIASNDSRTSGAVPTATPGQSAQVPPGHTGIAEVDAVIDAVLSGHHAQVEALLKLEPVGCSKERYGTPIVPFCGDSEAPGTPHLAFPIPSCGDGGWIDAQFPWIDSLLLRKPAIYAIYQRQPQLASPPNGFPSGRYVVIWQYTGIPGGSGAALEVDGGRIVTESGGCGPFPGELVKGVPLANFLVAPTGGLPTPTPTPATRHTGDRANDRLIDAMTSGDWQAIAAAFDTFPETCVVNPQGVGSPPPCPSGVSSGGITMTTRVLSCERGSASESLFRQIFRWGYEVYAAFPSTAMPTGGPYQYSRDWVPAGDMIVVLREQGTTQGIAWHLAGGHIVGARLGCGSTAEAFVKDVPKGAFILPPLP